MSGDLAHHQLVTLDGAMPAIDVTAIFESIGVDDRLVVDGHLQGLEAVLCREAGNAVNIGIERRFSEILSDEQTRAADGFLRRCTPEFLDVAMMIALAEYGATRISGRSEGRAHHIRTRRGWSPSRVARRKVMEPPTGGGLISPLAEPGRPPSWPRPICRSRPAGASDAPPGSSRLPGRCWCRQP